MAKKKEKSGNQKYSKYELPPKTEKKLSKFFLKKFGNTFKEFLKSKWTLKKDLKVIIFIEPKHHYRVDGCLTIKAGTRILISGFIERQSWWVDEVRLNTVCLEVDPSPFRENLGLEVNLEELVEALK